MIPNRFDGRLSVITGGGGDIGRAVAAGLLSHGLAVALVDLDEEKLHLASNELAVNGGAVSTHVCDVTSYSSVRALVDSLVSIYGRVDYLFNNAGYQGEIVPTHRYPHEDFARVIDVNVTGVFHVLRAVSEVMVDARFGSIVNTASGAGSKGPPNMVAYSASKAAIITLTKTAAKDLAPYNIRVNSVSPALVGPGFMWDRQVRCQAEADSQYFSRDYSVVERQMVESIPMRRLGRMDEIAPAVTFLLSEESSYITGVDLPVAGGAV